MTAAGLALPPPTYAQSMVDTLESWAPGRIRGPRSVLAAAHRVAGPVNVAALSAALFDVVARHGALRTAVVSQPQPYQQVREPAPVPLSVRALDPECTPERFVHLVLDRDYLSDAIPPLWAYLGRYAEDDALLVLVAHRTAVDEWSLPVLARDLVAAYTARVRGGPPLGAEVMQYTDIGADDYSHNWLDRIARLVPYWQDRLAGAADLGIPAPNAGSEPDRPDRSVARFDLGDDLWRRITSTARQRRTTPFTVLLTAYVATVLGDRTGEAVVPLLTPGRTPAERDTVGCLYNMLSLRLNLVAGDWAGPTGRENLLRLVNAACREAYVNDIPLLPVLRETPDLAVALRRRDRILPFFQYVPPPPIQAFVAAPALRLTPLAVAPVPLPMLPTSLLWRFSGAGPVAGQVLYDPDLFGTEWISARIEEYLDRLTRLVDAE